MLDARIARGRAWFALRSYRSHGAGMPDRLLAVVRTRVAILASRADLTIENRALRQQRAVLQRKNPRPRLPAIDRFLWLPCAAGGPDGRRRSQAFSPQSSFAGIAEASDGTGAGNRGATLDARAERPKFALSCAGWRPKTVGRRATPSRRDPEASVSSSPSATCPASCPGVQSIQRRVSAGERSSATTARSSPRSTSSRSPPPRSACSTSSSSSTTHSAC